jgi:PAS domain S-box-containing protein
MREKKYKIGFIASSIQLVNHAREISEELGYDINVSSSGLDAAIPIGRHMEASGVEVIVSRGGTSNMLRESLRIPVLSIPLTYFDIFTSVKKAVALGNNKKIMIAVFRNQLSGIEAFEEVFNIKILQGIYSNYDTLEKAIHSAQNRGYDVAIGGGVTMKIANKCGLKTVELETAKETIASIIEDATYVVRSRRKDQEKAQRYQSIIDSTSEGIIAVNQHGVITAINKTAKTFLKISDLDIIGKPVSNYINRPSVVHVMETGIPDFNKLENINRDQFISNHIPITVGSKIIGGVSTFKDISNVVRAENEVRRSFAKGLIAKYNLADFIHGSKVIKKTLNRAVKFADSDSTILIMGDTGTGKEILAHSIHNLGRRKRSPFVSINCSALPDQLLESELFGYEEGAFTGSRRGGKPGLFEIAHHGTIFLDEIGTTPGSVQARLLRVLQEKEVMRIGGDRMIPVDVRVIAATNKNLIKEVHAGRFREDLFFRINVLNIVIPPLRERAEDIPLLMKSLVKRAGEKYGLTPLSIADTYVKKLLNYDWPGNVRQLETFIERLTLLSNSKFNPEVFSQLLQELYEYPSTPENHGETDKKTLKDTIQFKNHEVEARMIRKALAETNFSKSKAAEKLGISRASLWRKLKSIDLDGDQGEYSAKAAK